MPFVAMDCEGPITLNDNAFELSRAVMPIGQAFFANVSRYDDFLADVEKRQGYKAGDTLKLILPFLKAFGVTNAFMEEFSRKTITFVPGARKMLKDLKEILPTFIISTSYKPYLEALSCDTGLPMKQIYCTDVDLDSYDLSEEEKTTLKDLASEVASMPRLSWPDQAHSRDDLYEPYASVLKRMDEIFWKIISEMDIGRIFREVNPVGGHEKAESVESASRRTGFGVEECLYVGDSITDVEAFLLVRKGGGITISFNGNNFAVKAAEFSVISSSASVMHLIVKAFAEVGSKTLRSFLKTRKGVSGDDLVQAMKDLGVKGHMIQLLECIGQDTFIFFNREELLSQIIAKSEDMRRLVRGMAIGSLG